MRWVFLLLLTINLGVLLWYTQIGAYQQQTKYPAAPDNVRQLVLLSERQNKQEAAAALLPKKEPDEEPTKLASSKIALPEIDILDAKPKREELAVESFVACYTFGPFKDAARLLEAKQQFVALGVSINQRASTESELYGYRVYIPPLASREAAAEVAKKLADHEIDDYFIIQEEEKRNGISLGLFRKKNGAIRRMAQIRRFGFKPVMEVRHRDREIFWLDLEQKQNVLTDEVWREISEGQHELQRLQRDCAA